MSSHTHPLIMKLIIALAIIAALYFIAWTALIAGSEDDPCAQGSELCI